MTRRPTDPPLHPLFRPSWMRQVEHDTWVGWSKLVSHPERLRAALLCTEHDRNSPVWRWTVQQLAELSLRGNHRRALEILLELEQGQINAQALWRSAAEAMDVQALARILARGSRVDPLAPTDLRSGQTAAHLAALAGDLGVLDWLFRHNGVGDRRNKQGQSAWDLLQKQPAFLELTDDLKSRWKRRFEAFASPLTSAVVRPAPLRPFPAKKR